MRTGNTPGGIKKLKDALAQADAVVIGAGSGLSTSAGFSYSGQRMMKYFGDMAERYGFHDMYSGGFYPYRTPEERWAFWGRNVYINRYMNPPKPVYDNLFSVIADKDYFVITTNVDHCFQKAGFAKERLYYTQGDYGLFQCSTPCHDKTYDNEKAVRDMVLAQGFSIAEQNGAAADGTAVRAGDLLPPAGTDGTTDFSKIKLTIPSALIPRCPVCGEPMSMNLRADDTFVQDDGWYQAAERYGAFLQQHQGRKVLFWELAVGHNTPGIIKFSFWKMTAENPQAVYACVNYAEAYAPEEIADRSIVINGDAGEMISQLLF